MPTADFDPLAILKDRVLRAMQTAFSDRLPQNADPLIQAARNPDFGDFQSNAAMPLAKALGEKPRDVAAKIVEHADLTGIAEPLTPESIAGPGFINIRLEPTALPNLLEKFDTPTLGIEPPAEPQTIVVDLCGVNLAKQMHVGHLRATVIGDAVARLFERLGHRAVRQNHLGDWGLPIAMVVRAVQQGETAQTLDDLNRIYRAAQRECKPDHKGLAAVRKYNLGPKAEAELEEQVASAEESLAEAKQTLVKMQSGDADAIAVWQRLIDITMRECLAACARLRANVTHEHTAGESSYRDDLPDVARDLEARNIATQSEGALVVDLADVGIKEPCLVRKSDGGYLYATTDLAAIRRRVQEIGASRVVYCVDARQALHFKQVFAAATKAGYAKLPDGSDAALEHAAFGTILGPDNKPFKSRSGENIKLTDLLDEAVERATAAVAEKNPDLPSDKRAHVAEAVGMTAIKYADLANERVRDYVFDFNRMLAFEGDTGPYLQYALVRIKSILRKAKSEGVTLDDNAELTITEPQEKTLALELLRFPSAVEAAADNLQPHRLCAYLQDLARAFSSFFENCPVLKAESETTRTARLRLAALTGRVLETGLETLGLVPLEEM